MNSPTRTDTITVSSSDPRLISAGIPEGFHSADFTLIHPQREPDR